jgi:hypothetical protein
MKYKKAPLKECVKEKRKSNILILTFKMRIESSSIVTHNRSDDVGAMARMCKVFVENTVQGLSYLS